LCFHAAAELFVEPLDGIGRSQRLPLRLWEAEECQELLAAFAQARYDARTPLAPRALEGRVCGARGVDIRRVDDAVEVVADLGQRVLRRFALKVAQLVHAAPLDHHLGPDESDDASQPRIPVDDRQHWRTQTPRDEIVEAAFPRRERLAAAQVEGE